MTKISSIEGIRENFPALEQSVNGRPLIYLDNGATAQKPKSVIDIVNTMNSAINGNVHRAVHELSTRSTHLYEAAREEIRQFLNAKHAEEIIFTSGTTAGINLIANSFASEYIEKGDAILITESEHHSNIVPWQMVCEKYGATLIALSVDDFGCWEIDKVDEILKKNKVKIVSASHISNVLGLVNPIEELVSMAHNYGIPVVIDGAQGVVHAEVDVQALDCDFYLFSGHKLYGPTGIGVLYGKKRWLEEMPPWMGGGDMIGSVSLKGFTCAELPLKFEAGTPNYIGAAGLGEAIRFINSIDKSIIFENEISIASYLNKELSKIEGVKVYGESERKTALFSINCKGVHPTDIASILDKMGIAVRSGQLCAEPLMERFGATSMLRASFGMYNTMEEATLFIEGLKRAIKMLI